MATYDPTNHPLLSPAAKALAPDQLEAQADRAESLHGIANTEFDGQDAKGLTLAVVLQVNRFLRLDARGDGEGADVVGESKGDQSIKYASPKGEAAEIVDPEAAAIVARVLDSVAPAHAPRVSSSIPNTFTW